MLQNILSSFHFKRLSTQITRRQNHINLLHIVPAQNIILTMLIYLKYLKNPPKTYLESLISKQKNNSSFTILIFFLLAFCLSRLAVYLDKFNLFPHYPFRNFFGTHVHHFVFGIALITITGFATLTLPHAILAKWRHKLSAIYGFGLGWVIDEFGMWLHLDQNYYLRASYDALIITMIILLNFAFFQKIWRKLFYKLVKDF